MTRILFIDDDALILRALQRLLEHRGHSYTAQFAIGGQQGIEAFDEAHPDVVVTDLDMPGASGLDVLEHVSNARPATVRVVLSGSANLTMVARSARHAHRLINKPAGAALLEETLAGVQRIAAVLATAKLQDAGLLDHLPMCPPKYIQLTTMIARDATINEIAGAVEESPALAGTLLKLVNSAFFGFSRPVHGVRDAVMIIGLRPLADLVLALGASEAIGTVPPALCDAFQRHAVTTSTLAGKIGRRRDRDVARTAGLLHSIGGMLLWIRRPAEMKQAVHESAKTGVPLAALQERDIGMSQAELAGHILDLWGLPRPLIETVHRSAEPPALNVELEASGSVHIASSLANESAPVPWCLTPEPRAAWRRIPSVVAATRSEE